MDRSSSRALGLMTAAPLLCLGLAACGSTAINSDYTPGSQGPSVGANGILISSPSKSASTQKPHKAKATTKATAHATHSSSSKSDGSSTSSHTSTGAKKTAPSAPHTSTTPSGPRITVSPSTGLTNGYTVTIQGYGFNPNLSQSLIAVECIDKGTRTGSSDCNINILALPKGFKPAANGTFTTTLKVVSHFGSNTCSASTPCLVSVTTPNDPPTEEADTPISFG